MTLHHRLLDPDRDMDAAARTWLECGWLEAGEDKQRAGFEEFVRSCTAWVGAPAEDVEPECLFLTTPGDLRHLRQELPLSVVAAVTVSRVARRRGLASRLTAHAVADSAEKGAVVSALGMFDQGFYDRLGFGNGPYDHMIEFDPNALRLPKDHPRPSAPPVRLTPEHADEMHASLLARRRGHGGVNLTHPGLTRGHSRMIRNGFGLGFRDPDTGELTHHFFAKVETGEEDSPVRLNWMSYQDRSQLLDLLGVLKDLGDQHTLIKILEPSDVRLQDLMDRPSRRQDMSAGGAAPERMWCLAWWQMRLLDIARAVGVLRLNSLRSVSFNLALSDPISDLLEPGRPWTGVGGDWTVELGPESSARKGRSEGLPTLQASVGAFTRLWLGAEPARALANTDDLSGPASLLDDLDEVVCLPVPRIDWDF